MPVAVNPPEKEEEILAWWEENGTFKESLRLSEGRKRLLKRADGTLYVPKLDGLVCNSVREVTQGDEGCGACL